MFACPVGDKENLLIRQIRSFGSLRKELVCMPHSQQMGKPKGAFRAPTYFIGGSNFFLHGRVGLFHNRLVFMTCIFLWRKIIKIFNMIENKKTIIFRYIFYSPPKLYLAS